MLGWKTNDATTCMQLWLSFEKRPQLTPDLSAKSSYSTHRFFQQQTSPMAQYVPSPAFFVKTLCVSHSKNSHVCFEVYAKNSRISLRILGPYLTMAFQPLGETLVKKVRLEDLPPEFSFLPKALNWKGQMKIPFEN